MTRDEVLARVREARGARAPLRVHGTGHWLDAGRPVRASTTLSLAGLSGVLEYTPGDLTLTARAGTTLAELARVTGAERQWLALDPFGAATGTIGATVATASAGPLAHAFGTPRDNVLGLEAVTGAGRVIRGGGRVVKNVAGFDLTRLFTGSWGTLGVITEVTVRLRALPECDESWAVAAEPAPGALGDLLDRLREAPLTPLAAELVNGPLARRVGAPEGTALLVRLGGTEARLCAERAALRALGPAEPVPAGVWSALAVCEGDAAVVVRCSAAPARTADGWQALSAATAEARDVILHATPGRGVVRCVLGSPSEAELQRLVACTGSFAGTTIWERLPADRWAAVAPALASPLARRIRAAFDPDELLNPGILGAAA